MLVALAGRRVTCSNDVSLEASQARSQGVVLLVGARGRRSELVMTGGHKRM